MIAIRRFRERMKWSQKDLAEILQVGQSTLHNWESGKRDPGTDLVRALFLLGATVEELFGIAYSPGTDKTRPNPKAADPLATSAIAKSILLRLTALEQGKAEFKIIAKNYKAKK